MPPPEPSAAADPAAIATGQLLRGALLLDLEVSMRGRILKLGVVRDDQAAAWDPGTGTAALEGLARFAGNATAVIGHNLVRHDLPCLREAVPNHPVLRLPVIDTLVLSPLAFPENPYHRLVKDHKLVRESLNDPVADARLAGTLFADEVRAFVGLRQTEPELFQLLATLLTTAEGPHDLLAAGFSRFFRAIASAATDTRPTTSIENGADRQDDRGASMLVTARRFIARFACAEAPLTAADLATTAQRHALAYTLAWLRVSGSNSVLPPWVRLQHPLSGSWIRRWRERPCASLDCAYCRRTHDAREQLKVYFAFDDFRPVPPNAGGGSLQRDIVEAGLRDESLLAILPTGGGKSLCFQLPALVRNFRRGVLTLVISPLQALMKDQVDGLVRRTGTPFAAALYGLLTPPERGDVLRRVVLGDVALLYVSPEQLRNVSFRQAIAQREIGCWVFDEAHCLSKWGHDFRPDYLYAGRFIREFSADHGGGIPPIACFTATAKEDVKAEIVKFFRDETGRELRLFEGGVERDNLRFQVQMITGHTKLERVQDLLADRLPPGQPGSAIVFRARRDRAEATAEFLQARGWPAAHFHAGLTAPEKKRIQEEFLAGDVRVICATNAFGMGIDKDDVRLVVHADTPGSLENYLQEAGRAGRDGRLAECVLLYDEEDCEDQFRLGARSELSRRDLAQILRGLRKAARGGKEEIVITTGEILRDEDVETSIALEERSADTRVRTAISWLERAGFIQRDENVTQVFQARLLIRTLGEAQARMASLNLPVTEHELWLAILRELMNAGPTESLTVDRLALLPQLTSYARRGPGGANPEYISAKVLKTLGSMAQAGLLKRDTLLNAFVRHKVADHSRIRFDRVVHLDRRLVDLLATEEPDPEGWMPLNLRLLNQRLCDELAGTAHPPAPAGAPPPGRTIENPGAVPGGPGHDRDDTPPGGPPAPLCTVELVRALLMSLGEDGRGFAGTHGSIDLHHVARDAYRVRVRRSWSAIAELAGKRRRVASVVLDVLLGKIPADTPPRADLLVAFAFEELHDAIDGDLVLRSEVKDIDAAIERALMYLHEQRVIILQQGLAVFRSAMRIRLAAGTRGQKYKASHYQPLQHHYRERILQIHVMSEYARRGLEAIREALGLVLAYFSMGKEEFIRRYLAARPDLLEHATTARSFQRIVTDLGNPAQLRVVTAPLDRNLLILAGPGSGKTRTVVHRCAYLLRVERVPPRSVLVCCFNRNAALELRQRLNDLAGADARGVTVLTYHALALRLLGRSLAGARTGAAGGAAHGPDPAEPDFDALIRDAVQLLRGGTATPGLEPDELRDRLLAGFRHILVDEYQDIDAPQYDLISALAGRTLDDPDQRLSILAVGDDDQSIYGFRGANVEFIRRFRADYDAEVHHLVENYRSTRQIIDAANQVIAANTDRMKTGHAIRVDKRREPHPAGGTFGAADPHTRGRVQVLTVPGAAAEAAAVVGELQRLRRLGVEDGSRCAVLAARHEDLARIRAAAEQAGLPVRWWATRGAIPPLRHVREIHAVLAHLETLRNRLVRASELPGQTAALLPDDPANPWAAFVRRAFAAWRDETDDTALPAIEAREFLLELCAESRRALSWGEGVNLGTVHAAKGTEHEHVILAGAWTLRGVPAADEELRRVFYVGMTRARHSLTVIERADAAPSIPATLTGPAVIRTTAPEGGGPVTADAPPVEYALLGLEDLNLGFAGCFNAAHRIHTALAALRPGDRVRLQALTGAGTGTAVGVGVFDAAGQCVARLSQKAAERWQGRLDQVREARVVAVVRRHAAQDTLPERRTRYVVTDWEVPALELVAG